MYVYIYIKPFGASCRSVHILDSLAETELT